MISSIIYISCTIVEKPRKSGADLDRSLTLELSSAHQFRDIAADLNKLAARLNIAAVSAHNTQFPHDPVSSFAPNSDSTSTNNLRALCDVRPRIHRAAESADSIPTGSLRIEFRQMKDDMALLAKRLTEAYDVYLGAPDHQLIQTTHQLVTTTLSST